jgi:excisionase family DNA binding protein
MIESLTAEEGDRHASHEAEFIDARAAARWLGIPLRSLYQYVQDGLLPSYKLGRHRLFRKRELLDARGASRTASRGEILR